MRFQGRTVVVTGASMGIGKAIAEAFAADGANLVLAARSESLLTELASQLEGFHGKVITVKADVTRPEEVADLAQQSMTLTGRVDVLVNNAGVGMNGAIESLDIDQWRQCFEVNVFGAVRVIQAFLPGMKSAGGGTIVQISSVLGKVSVPFTGGYNASKHALNAISDALRVEAAQNGIHVVSVYPGSTESQFRANSLGEANTPKIRPGRVTAARVGKRVVQAVLRGERDVYVRFQDALLCWFGTRFPRLSDLVLRSAYKEKK